MATCRSVGTLREPARRVISLAPSLTENLFFLQLGSKVVGITEQCDVVEAAGVERIGGFSTPDLSRIRELEADLVLGLDRFQDRFADELTAAGIPMLLFSYATVDDIFAGMEEIARATGSVESAAPLFSALRDRVSRVRSVASLRQSPRVFRLMTDDPIITPANACYQTDAIRLAGGDTMDLSFAEAYVSVTLEDVLGFDPEVILSCGFETDEHAPKERCRGCKAVKRSCERDVRELVRRAGWSSTSAARQGQVRALSCGLLCRPGPRTVDGIELIAEIFSRSMRVPAASQDGRR